MLREKTVTMAAALALSLGTAACKVEGSGVPPPIRDGKCLVARWVGALAVDQTCQLGGYSWHCESAAGHPSGCIRGPEVGEAPTQPAAQGGAQ